MTPPRAGPVLGHRRPHATCEFDPEPGGTKTHGSHSTSSVERRRGPGRRRGRSRHPRPARAGPNDAEEGADGRPGRRHRVLRSPHEHVVQRHPRLLQPLRQPDEPASRRQALPRARHGVEARGADHLAVQAAAGREVPQRRPLHLGGREGEPRADLRSRRQDPRGHGLHHHRPHRGAGSDDAGRPHEEAGPAPAGAARVLRRADRPGQVPEGDRRGGLQSQARRHGAGPVRLVDQGRSPDHGSQPGLLGRPDRGGPGRSSARCPRRPLASPAC